MKTISLSILCALGFAVGAFAQAPALTPGAPPPATTPTLSASATPESQLEQSIKKKQKKHFKFSINDHDEDSDSSASSSDSHDDVPWMAIPIVAIIFIMVFGAPVAIVFVIMLMNYFRVRSLHRTVRMMVEKGQPVPAALLSGPASIVKPRSDLRRGVVLMAVGIATVMFFGIDDGWHDGAWALGLIPGLIGVGYLIVWRLEGPGRKPMTDNPPPLP